MARLLRRGRRSSSDPDAPWRRDDGEAAVDTSPGDADVAPERSIGRWRPFPFSAGRGRRRTPPDPMSPTTESGAASTEPAVEEEDLAAWRDDTPWEPYRPAPSEPDDEAWREAEPEPATAEPAVATGGSDGAPAATGGADGAPAATGGADGAPAATAATTATAVTSATSATEPGVAEEDRATVAGEGPAAVEAPRGRRPLVAVEDLVRIYPGPQGVTALHGVSLAVGPGEFVALMGPSGSGKSTLLGLMAGLDRPAEGRLLWRGEPFDRLGREAVLEVRRRRLGMVFQSFGLLPTLSALENVELPLRVGGADLDRADDAARSWLERLGLGDRLDNRLFELSAGQQQRVAVARALVIEPDVVLADEPIAEVDSENADLILEALSDVPRRGGAVICATHNPAALSYSTRAVLLRDGRIELEGRPDEVAGHLTTD
jgi:putative ABC transport system ATP-binding protein